MRQDIPHLVVLRLVFAIALLAIQTSGSVQNVRYVAAFQPLFSSSIPFSGTLVLNYNHGVINGRYNDMSIQPNAPFTNRFDVPVAGGTDGDNIHLTIGGLFSINGKIMGDTISGSATYRGRIYEFLAKQGVPKQH